MKTHGFTLVELLFVVSIIGLLSSIVLGALNDARESARITALEHFEANVDHAVRDELVGEWLFDECGGTIAQDSSGFNNNGSYGGTPTSSVDTLSGEGCSMEFDGTSFINIPDSRSLSSTAGITISAWVKLNGTTQGSMIRKGDEWHLIFNGTNIEFYVDANPGWTRISGFAWHASLPTDEWHHIVALYDTENYPKLYINGEPGRVATMSSGLGPMVPTSESIRLGNWSTDTFTGHIDDVRVYTRAVTLTEVEQLYAQDLEKYRSLASH